MSLCEVPSFKKNELSAFLSKSSSLTHASRLKYFYDLFPYAELIPGSFFILDPNSVILACNNYAWQQIKLDHVYEMVGNTALDISRIKNWPSVVANRIIENDKKVLETGLSIQEEVVFDDNIEKKLLSKKEAIYQDNGKALGIIGISLPIYSKSSKISYDGRKKHFIIKLNQEHSVTLTPREFTILQGLLNGKTANESAIKCDISVKTVETYIMRIKIKFNCEKQRDLIPLLIKLDLANSILNQML